FIKYFQYNNAREPHRGIKQFQRIMRESGFRLAHVKNHITLATKCDGYYVADPRPLDILTINWVDSCGDDEIEEHDSGILLGRAVGAATLAAASSASVAVARVAALPAPRPSPVIENLQAAMARATRSQTSKQQHHLQQQHQQQQKSMTKLFQQGC
ncbi:uncharacterized protein EV154DRAFT_528632, partial [Mucor mucedo]|uniref:uncharacterized protein n=1 Tax=Mucor mucedo TaxID=29922 RepID=UPI00221F0675